MRNFLYAIAIGLIGAALLHIVIILSLPSFTGRDAYTRVQSLGEANRFYKLAEKPGDTLAPINDDPAMETSVCTFSVENSRSASMRKATCPSGRSPSMTRPQTRSSA